MCVCVRVYTHSHTHTLPPALKIEKTQTTPLSFLLSKIAPYAKQQALRAAAPEWTFKQINFVAGRRGAVVEDDFYNQLEKLNVQAGKKQNSVGACATHMRSA